MIRIKGLLSVVTAVVLGLHTAGCGGKLQHVLAPNQAPSLTISQALVGASDGETFRGRVSWNAGDVDGRVDHYLFAVDPPSVDRVDASWQSTCDRERLFVFAVRSPSTTGDLGTRAPHIVVVRAVDNGGAVSQPQVAAFFADNLPPIVQITNPRPSALIEPVLAPTVTITWTGVDPDGQTTTTPVKYKHLLLGPGSEFPIDLATANPDSLRRYYAPAFAGWDSTGADTTSVRYQNLTLGARYLFVVTAFDEAGDYDPIFSLNKNMLRFAVGYPKVLGPRITLSTLGLEYTYPSGQYIDDPSAYVNVDVPGAAPLTFSWYATPQAGMSVAGYRWVLDPVDLYDDTPRSDPADLVHWSARDGTTSVTLDPFGPGLKGTSHRLYVEAMDSQGMLSLGIFNLFVTPMLNDRDLLIVDDTRLRPDQVVGGTYRPPLGPWPTAAELDTFLYAVGGMPYKAYPTGTLSPSGIFTGYRFDTLGTRTGSLATFGVPLSTLGRYRHVIWYVDGRSATYSKSPVSGIDPTTVLRYMSGPGGANTLASYVAGGGKLWLAGGGTAFASQIPWNDPANDTPTYVFSSRSVRRELAPGRFMYDVPMWQSEIRVASAPAPPSRFLGRLEGDPGYATLPTAMEPKTVATDPLPPLRLSSDFYRSTFDLEFLQLENYIIESTPSGEESTLDTLFEARGPSLPDPATNPHNVVMTYYHGPSHGGVVFTGFNFWSFKRQQCVQLTDFVLQTLWGLQRQAPVWARGTSRVRDD